MSYNVTTLRFEWNLSKARNNLQKHGVSFEMASTIFEDPFHLSIFDNDSRNEDRWITMGLSLDQRILVVIHTDRRSIGGNEVIRIISARTATKKERKDYEEGI